MKLYRNARLYLDGKFTEPDCVYTENGRIAAIGEADLQADEIIDLNGDYLLPGFVDVHIHGFRGHDTMRGEADVRAMSRELAKEGVAAFLPTTMSASPEATAAALEGVRAVMLNPEKDGAVVLGAHMEAPFLSAGRAGAQPACYFADPTKENWEKYTGGCENIVRMVTMAPERENALAFIGYLTGRGITVSLGHTDADAECVHAAADAGATHVTHTFNAQTPVNHRKPGVPGAALTDDRLMCEFIGDGIHLHPDIVRLLIRCKGRDRAAAITDAMEAAGMPDGCYELGGQQVFAKDGAARLADGTLAGSTLTLGRALLNLIRFGIPAEDAAAMVTCTPARSVGNTEFGVIRVGAPAVFVRLSKTLDSVTRV